MFEQNILYWDIELKTRKSITPITKYIIDHGGFVTDTFAPDDIDIFLLRARMTPELMDQVKLIKGVKSIEKPPRYIGQ